MEFAGYRIEGEIARGGMGVVYRGRDAAGQAVALKVLHSASPKAQRRFAREAQALLQLNHPNLIRLRDVGEVSGRAFVAMDLVEGESLQDRLGSGGPFAPRTAVLLAAQVARALGHVHDRQLLHRDVKPANVLLDTSGRARLTDFGLVKDLASDASQLSRSGSFLGSPGYWPPEQATGKVHEVGPPADVYALGATLYALLTDRPPFVATTIIQSVHQAAHATPLPPSRVRRGLDPRIDRVVLRCLAKNPAYRYADGHELARALEDCLQEAPRGRTGLAVGVGVAVALLGSAAAGLWLLGDSAEPAPLVAKNDQGSSPDLEPTAPPPAAPDTSSEVEPETSPSADPEPEDEEPAVERTIEEWLELARSHRRQGEFEQALAAYDQAIELDPERLGSYNARGTARFRSGDRAGALADYRKVLELDPQHNTAGMARTLVKRLERELGQQPPPRAPPGEPPSDRAGALRHWSRIAARHEQASEWAEAEAAYVQLLEVDPKLPTTYSRRATLRVKSGDKRGALSDYRRFLELFEGPQGLRDRVEQVARKLEQELEK